MDINKPNKYFAFISYKREDEEWAVWFHHELENYHLPATLNGRADLPTEFRPVFRDIDELKAGNLPEQIYDALATSAYLIVICSPNSAKSKWVNKEIEDFIEIGKAKGVDNVRNIFPFIVEGCPHAKNEAEECFPTSLLNLQDKEERIGGNVNESGRDKAFVKVLAGMLPNVAFDELWNRYEQDKAEEERKKREERNKLLISQSRFAAEKANKLVEEGDSYTARRLLLEVMPKSINNPDRPYVIEAETALRNACRHNSAIFKGYEYSVPAISPDGKLIAASDYESIKVWDTETGMEVLSIHDECAKKVHSVDISSDGKYLLSSSSHVGSKSIDIWDLMTGMPIRSIVVQEPVFSASFSPDVKFIVSVLPKNVIKVWTVVTGELFKTLEGETAAFSPDGTRIVSASWLGLRDRITRIWDIPTGDQLVCLKGYTRVNTASFRPDGRRLVSADKKSVIIYDVDTLSGKQLKCFEGHTGYVNTAVFSPYGRLVVSASDDKTIRVWDVVTGEQLQCLEGHAGEVKYAAFSPDGKRIVSSSSDGTIRIWDTLSVEKRLTSRGMSAAISPDGKCIVSAEWKSVIIYDVVTGKQLKCFEGHTDRVNTAVFSSDGNFVVSSSYDHTIRIWNVATGKQVRCMENHTSINTATFSPDGKSVLSTSRDQGVCIWDIETGEITQSLTAPSLVITTANFDLDGRKIVYGFNNGFAKIWEVDTGRVILTLTGHSRAITSASFSPDGKCIVTASRDCTIRIWEAVTGKQLKCLKGHTGHINSASFSPNGKYIVSASDDQSVRIWDIETGKEIQSFLGDRRTVLSASFSPNGRCIVSAGITGVRIWPFLPLQELIDQTRDRFKDRPLTPEEREQYYLE